MLVLSLKYSVIKYILVEISSLASTPLFVALKVKRYYIVINNSFSYFFIIRLNYFYSVSLPISKLFSTHCTFNFKQMTNLPYRRKRNRSGYHTFRLR